VKNEKQNIGKKVIKLVFMGFVFLIFGGILLRQQEEILGYVMGGIGLFIIAALPPIFIDE